MSQIVLDDQLDAQILVPALQAWTTAVRLQQLRPGEQILDDRVPEILRILRRPTFVTIDHGFWNRRLCHPDYCIVYFDCAADEQRRLPGLLRRLFHLPEFRTRAARMGKVVAVRRESVFYREFGAKSARSLPL